MKFDFEFRRSLLLQLIAALMVAGGSPGFLRAAVVSSSNGKQIGRILSVRKVPQWQPHPLSIHLQIHYYELFFSVQVSDQTYCAEYTTPVLDEIDDLFSANGKNVEIIVKKTDLTARTPTGRRIKAHLVKANRCSDPTTGTALTLPEFTESEASRGPISDPQTQATLVTQPAAEHGKRVGSSDSRDREPEKLITGPLITSYVNRVAQRIVTHSDVQLRTTVKVIEAKEINAFVLPGQYFYVNSGLILASDSEAELASILAHEIAHLAARHDARIQRRRRMWRIASLCSGPVGLPVQVAGLLSSMKLHRDAEREADRLGLEYEYEAGYDPRAFVQFLEKVNATDERRESLVANAFGTHPPTEERIRRAREEISIVLPPRSEQVIDTSEFQQMKLRLSAFKESQQSSHAPSTPHADFRFAGDTSAPGDQPPSSSGHELVFLLDTNPHQKKVLGVELSVAEEVIEKLGQPGNVFSVISFGSQPPTLVKSAVPADAALAAIKGITLEQTKEKDFSVHFYDALNLAFAQFSDAARPKSILVVSEGNDYFPGKSFKQTVSRAQQLRLAVDVAMVAGHTFYGTKGIQRYGFDLRRLSGKTHGQYVEVGGKQKKVPHSAERLSDAILSR